MENETAISNEEIIAALLQHGTIKEAAAAVGASSRAIYDRMQKKSFRAEYKAAKADIVRKAVINLNGKIAEAITAISDIMNDPGTNPAVRLQAAQTILNNAGKFTERLWQDEAAAREEAADPWTDLYQMIKGE